VATAGLAAVAAQAIPRAYARSPILAPALPAHQPGENAEIDCAAMERAAQRNHGLSRPFGGCALMSNTPTALYRNGSATRRSNAQLVWISAAAVYLTFAPGFQSLGGVANEWRLLAWQPLQRNRSRGRLRADPSLHPQLAYPSCRKG
jgi:hypothetical protein